jgi:aroK protein
MVIFLIGMMGAGKSTVGLALAKMLDYEFVDLDAVIAKNTELSISQIFEQFGEAEFRNIEKRILKENIRENAVIATGGGSVINAENRELMEKTENKKVIWLKAPPSVIAKRLNEDVTRPLLKGKNIVEQIAELLKIREEMYGAVADVVLDTENYTQYELAEKIVGLLAKI